MSGSPVSRGLEDQRPGHRHDRTGIVSDRDRRQLALLDDPDGEVDVEIHRHREMGTVKPDATDGQVHDWMTRRGQPVRAETDDLLRAGLLQGPPAGFEFLPGGRQLERARERAGDSKGAA